jgi:hypothetical protein
MNRAIPILLLSLTALATAQPEPSVSFTLNVTVLDPAGQPIVNCPVAATSSPGSAFNLTGADGIASFSLERNANEQYATFSLHSGARVWVDEQQRDLSIARFHELRGSYAFRDTHVVNVAQQGDPATATMQALPAVKVEGHITRPDGSHFDSLVSIRGYRDYARVRASDGLFSLEGVPRSHAVELWIPGEGTETHSVFLDPGQTANDLDIGDIIVEDEPRVSAIQGTIQGLPDDYVFPADAQDVYDQRRLERGITLVRADGQSVHSLSLDDFGKILIVVQMVADNTDIPMAEGEFYIVPGPYPGSTTGLALLDSVRAGRQAQLDAAGVPKFTFVAGETTEVEFDAQAVVEAVMSVGADLLR